MHLQPGLLFVPPVQLAALLFPGLANRGISGDMRPVEMYSQTASGYAYWKIPKAYLTFTPNWSGGKQDFIDVEAAIYWESDEMPPWSKAGRGDATGRKPDDKLFVHISGAGNFSGRRWWETFVLPRLEVVGAVGDLIEYRYRPGPGAMSSAVYAPREQGNYTMHFECVRNSYGNLLGCKTRTDYTRDIALEYVFSSNHISRWKEIDAKARALVDSFRSPQTAFPDSD
jgi:hypothetical protein